MSRVLPILFKAEMVRAILDGRKTVTRRPVKGLPEGTYRIEQTGEYDWEALYGIQNCGAFLDMHKAVNPPYQPGDILYVRETWTYHEGAIDGIIYKARCPEKLAKIKKWRPSIHMPKEAARIWLRCTNVRVERLRPMGLDDFEAEGLSTVTGLFDTTAQWADLWDSTLKKSDLDRYG